MYSYVVYCSLVENYSAGARGLKRCAIKQLVNVPVPRTVCIYTFNGKVTKQWCPATMRKLTALCQLALCAALEISATKGP